MKDNLGNPDYLHKLIKLQYKIVGLRGHWSLTNTV